MWGPGVNFTFRLLAIVVHGQQIRIEAADANRSAGSSEPETGFL